MVGTMALTPAAAQFLKLQDATNQSLARRDGSVDDRSIKQLQARFDALSPDDRLSLREDTATKMRAHIQGELASPNLDPRAKASLERGLELLNKGQLPSPKGPPIDIKTGNPVTTAPLESGASTFAPDRNAIHVIR